MDLKQQIESLKDIVEQLAQKIDSSLRIEEEDGRYKLTVRERGW